MSLKLKDIKEFCGHTFKCMDGTYSLYGDTIDQYQGNVRLDNGKFFYTGLPDCNNVRFKTIAELDMLIQQYLTDCEERWIDCRAYDHMTNKQCHVRYALSYLAKKLGWSAVPLNEGEGYRVGALSMGTEVLRVQEVNELNEQDACCFAIGLGKYNGIYSSDFTDYCEAMDWLKSKISLIMTCAGIEILNQALNPHMRSDSFDDTIVNHLSFTGGLPDVQKFSLRDTLIPIMEKQLAILKNAKPVNNN